MRPQSVTVSSLTTSNPIPLDHRSLNFQVGIGCVVPSGTLTYKVQHTFDDIFDTTVTPVWFDHTSITGKTTNSDGNYAFPIRAVRLNVTAYTSGSVIMTVLQSSGNA